MDFIEKQRSNQIFSGSELHKIVKELDVIIVMADQLKNMATGLRKKLARVDAPATRKGKGPTPEQIARVIARKNSYLKIQKEKD